MKKDNLKLTLLLFIIAAAFQACSQDDVEHRNNQPAKNTYYSYMQSIRLRPQRSVKEAKILASIYGKETYGVTRAGDYDSKNWEIEEVLSDVKPRTRATNERDSIMPVDTMFYILNNPATNSFCIVSGDRRLDDDVLAFSCDGILELDSLDGSEGINDFLSRLPDYYRLRFDNFKKHNGHEKPEWFEDTKKDTIDPYSPLRPKTESGGQDLCEITDKMIEPERSIPEVPHKVEVVGPYSPNCWGIEDPSEYLSYWHKREYSLIECATIATAQLVSTFQYPKSYKDERFDWELLHKYKSLKDVPTEKEQYLSQMLKLHQKIGEIMDVNKNFYNTKDNFLKIPYVLKNMGYSYPSSITDYRTTDVIQSIKNKSLVPMFGYATKYAHHIWFIRTSGYKYKDGYVWLCDGYEKMEMGVEAYTDRGIEFLGNGKTYYLLHINWGMGGKYNGYFLVNVFSPGKLGDYDKKDSDGTENKDNTQYKYHLKTILNIKP